MSISDPRLLSDATQPGSDEQAFLAKLKSEVGDATKANRLTDPQSDSGYAAAYFAQFTLERLNELFKRKFQCISLLGAGAMSVIFKARNLTNHKLVAIKMLPVKLDKGSMQYQRFVREGQTLQHLDHPNIISFHDFGQLETGEAYFVMDYLDGESLDSLIKRAGPLPLARSVMIFSSICAGMTHAHKSGVLHRDLKPSNVMLLPRSDGSDGVRIVDFGLAKLMPNHGELHQELTKNGEIFGTPYYMSPEACSGKPMDVRSDIYAFGCLMYETVTGRPPHVGETSLATLLKHLSDKVTPPSSVRKDIQLLPLLEEVILKALEKNPNHRYQSMEELKEDISAMEAKLSNSRLRQAMVTAPAPSTTELGTNFGAILKQLPISQFWLTVALTAGMFILALCILLTTLTHF